MAAGWPADLLRPPSPLLLRLERQLPVVDSFRCGNGYSTDNHDLLLLPSGHAVLMSYDPQVVDLSQVVKDGRPNAIVIGPDHPGADRRRAWCSSGVAGITSDHGRRLAQPDRGVVDYVHGNRSMPMRGESHHFLRHMNE